MATKGTARRAPTVDEAIIYQVMISSLETTSKD